MSALVPCPRCGESNRSGRLRCWVCDGDLTPLPAAAAPREPPAKATAASVFSSILKVMLMTIAIVAGIIGLLVVLFLVTCFGLIAASGGFK
jgi:hypothetical protein